MLTIILPILPPTVNHMYASNKGGGKRLTSEAQAFRVEAILRTRNAAALSGYALPAGPLALEMRLTFPTNRRQDIDNRIKSALDALALALDFDDTRIVRITVERAGYGAARCELTLMPHRASYAAALDAARVVLP